MDTVIRDAPAPHTLAALRSFLGLISWCSEFLPNFSTVVGPIRALVRDATHPSCKWNEEAEHSFNELKQLLLDSPVLAQFDPSLLTFVTTDASDYRLGGCADSSKPR